MPPTDWHLKRVSVPLSIATLTKSVDRVCMSNLEEKGIDLNHLIDVMFRNLCGL